MQQYANVMMVSDSTMANGMSRFGFFASSPVRHERVGYCVFLPPEDSPALALLTRSGHGVETDKPVKTFGRPRGHSGPAERQETAFAASRAFRYVLFRYTPVVRVD